MLKRALALTAPFALLLAVLPGSPAAEGGWYEKAVKKVEASFDPAEAKPGQTVTLKITIELNEGYHTYPTVQPEKAAASMVNKIKFPDPGTVVFVGTTADPKDFDVKAEPELGIRAMRIMKDKVTFTRTAVVSPKAVAGAAKVQVTEFKLLVCDEKNCFPPKKLDTIEAALKVLDGPAVPVEKDYADEVAKALAGK